MSFLQTNLLQAPVNKALNIYEILIRIIKKSKAVGTSVAIFMLLAYVVRDRIFKPPKSLLHIPYFRYYSIIKSLYKRESLFDCAARLTILFINDSSNDGLYLIIVDLPYLCQNFPMIVNIVDFRFSNNKKKLNDTSCSRSCFIVTLVLHDTRYTNFSI